MATSSKYLSMPHMPTLPKAEEKTTPSTAFMDLLGMGDKHKSSEQYFEEGLHFYSIANSKSPDALVAAISAHDAFQAAALRGYPKACTMLGKIFIKGLGKISQDSKEAIRWLTEAKKHTPSDAEASILLAEIHRYTHPEIAAREISVAEDCATTTRNPDLTFKILQYYSEYKKAIEQSTYEIFTEEEDLFNNQILASYVHWLLQAVTFNHPHAEYVLSTCYQHGVTIGHKTFEKDAKKARHFLNKAARSDRDAQYELASQLEALPAPAADVITTTDKLYREAARQYHQGAQLALARRLVKRKTSQEFDEGMKLYSELAQTHHLHALVELGDLYRKGNTFLKRAPHSAIICYQQALAHAKKGLENTPQVKFKLSELLREEGPDKNIRLADQLRREAAEGECVEAHFSIIVSLLQEEDHTDEAMRQLQMLAESDYIPAQFKLGKIMLEKSDDTALTQMERVELLKEGIGWCEVAAIAGFLPAALFLKRRYANAEDYISGCLYKKWVFHCAKLKDVESIFQSAVILEDQLKHKEAFRQYKEAAEKGFPRAQFALGRLCEEKSHFLSIMEFECAQDESTKWYTKAAEQNEVNAQFKLGAQYLKGENVLQDEKKGVEWLLKACESGHVEAKRNLMTAKISDPHLQLLALIHTADIVRPKKNKKLNDRVKGKSGIFSKTKLRNQRAALALFQQSELKLQQKLLLGVDSESKALIQHEYQKYIVMIESLLAECGKTSSPFSLESTLIILQFIIYPDFFENCRQSIRTLRSPQYVGEQISKELKSHLSTSKYIGARRLVASINEWRSLDEDTLRTLLRWVDDEIGNARRAIPQLKLFESASKHREFIKICESILMKNISSENLSALRREIASHPESKSPK